MSLFLSASILGLLAGFFPLAFAAPTPDCPFNDFLPCAGGGLAGISTKVTEKLVTPLKTAVVAIAIGMFFYYAVQLLIASDDENAVTNTKTAYTHAIAGCIIISIAAILFETFYKTGAAADTFVAPAPLKGAFDNIIEYFKIFLAVAVSINITIQGIRMIALQGREGEVEKQKTKFLHGLLGVVIIILAQKLVDAVTKGKPATILPNEISGIANFLITLFGVLVVISFMVGGAMLMLSVDEGNKDKGKKIIFGSVILTIIVISSWAIVRFFLGL